MGRILTVGFWTEAGSIEVVFKADSLLAISHSHTVGGQDEIVAQRSLQEVEVRRIRNALLGIPADCHGKVYRKHIDDGIHMWLRFSDNGESSPQDIRLENAWCDGVAEVAGVVSALVPGEVEVPTRDVMQPPYLNAPVEILTISEADKPWLPPHGDYPWWLLWPKIVLHVVAIRWAIPR